ncbi:MAG: 16S rRNA (guanine(527)-N(7))-methyltransferase RsmG [Microscillaceae bacterium]|nr:16S rRNA (guanine(527)-N(7))-methyltransferase RsmG [Microscillaceae bacterium]MDW8460047.1 16S rRNA (guanine(527)-N(7))-methyltransferase RsmG [Cytophagales bacterium]
MEILLKYFPDLTPTQIEQFGRLHSLYTAWNAKINVISRKDIDFLYERHVLHSLGIAKIIQFQPQAEVMDLGTGGGFPAIPLAILFPETKFLAVDSIGKKITVVKDIAQNLQLNNLETMHQRAEKINRQFDFVVSRAVAPLLDLYKWTNNKFYRMYNHSLKNGIICLKGGDLSQEIAQVHRPIQVFDLKNIFQEDFFAEKKVVYVQMIK